MFKKKICKRCGNTLRNKYAFCPYCGNILDKKEENFGMLGKDDSLNQMSPFGDSGFSGFNMIFNSLIRNLEKQFKEVEKQNPTVNPQDKQQNEMGNISISISSFGGKSPSVTMNSIPIDKKNSEKKKVKKFVDNLPSDRLKKFSSLPREEPKTNIRRLSNKLIYEISLPGVKSLKDISLLNLEKNRELKAVSDDKSYLKSIPNFPIINYKLSKGKFILELDARD
ncbi:MAG: hypothetical protein WAU65_00765 [Candidatus Nanoarchaeia archaeon]